MARNARQVPQMTEQPCTPMLTFGKAGGRIKTGLAIEAKGDSVARVGLTVQQALGVRTSSWGTESNTTARPFTEIMNA